MPLKCKNINSKLKNVKKYKIKTIYYFKSSQYEKFFSLYSI